MLDRGPQVTCRPRMLFLKPENFIQLQKLIDMWVRRLRFQKDIPSQRHLQLNAWGDTDKCSNGKGNGGAALSSRFLRPSQVSHYRSGLPDSHVMDFPARVCQRESYVAIPPQECRDETGQVKTHPQTLGGMVPILYVFCETELVKIRPIKQLWIQPGLIAEYL